MTSEETEAHRALVARMVDETVAKYRHLLPAAALTDLREQMEGFALTHPEMRKMLDRLRPRAVADVSDERSKEGKPAAEKQRAAAGRQGR